MKTLLISLKPRHCKNIFEGKKTMELRKRSPKCYSTIEGKFFPEFTHIMIYQSVRHEIVGIVEAGEIITRFKDEWTKDEIKSLCISKDEIISYTGDRKGVGIKIFNPRLFNTPIPIRVMINDFGIHPPQQFKYLNSDLSKKLINFGQTDTARNVARI
jgi:predicted transcriptional regulator